MILELDTSLLSLDINLNQLVLLNLVIKGNQIKHQTLLKLFSLVKEEDIQDLVERNLLLITTFEGETAYEITEKVETLIKRVDTFFDEFYRAFPIYVHRPDGTKGFLRANVNKCRKEYNRIVGKSSAKHEHIMDCLNRELSDKTSTGKLGYMKTMWEWLTQCEWEVYEDYLLEDEETVYGATII